MYYVLDMETGEVLAVTTWLEIAEETAENLRHDGVRVGVTTLTPEDDPCRVVLDEHGTIHVTAWVEAPDGTVSDMHRKVKPGEEFDGLSYEEWRAKAAKGPRPT